LTIIMSLFLFTAVVLSGCGNSDGQEKQNTDNKTGVSQENLASDGNSGGSTNSQDGKADDTRENLETELEVRFGDDGSPFILQLNGSDTSAAIARYVGTSDWRLPIYENDKDADYDVMQYYDIPSSYDIPSAPEKVTSVKAGEVYYSDPNRIVLFYQDAEISEEEYTPVGYFDATDEFVEAVKNNPVLEGWGNKIVLITKP
ncbi:MAG: hypothetical protein K2I10_09090, partial [Lachnospiraceae bacterium]|nr:hypothetical protein [Lachnospiraceae bacterium]